MKKTILAVALILATSINAQTTAKDYYKKGLSIMEGGTKNLQAAIEEFSKAIELSPKTGQSFETGQAYGSRAWCKKQLKDYKGAIEDYNKAIEFQPKFAVAFSERGECKFYLNDFKGDVEDQTKALEQYEDAKYYYLRGDAKYMLGEYKEAIFDLNKCLATFQYDMAYIKRGQCKLKLSDKAGACADFKTARNNGNVVEAVAMLNEFCK
jgi:tetratricopeptide (TPR) repeat protein